MGNASMVTNETAAYWNLVPRPDRPLDVVALDWLGKRLQGAVVKVVREGTLVGLRRPDWSRLSEDLANVFGYARAHHCFHAKPLWWLRPTEPQVTRGWAYFLDAANVGADVARARVRATLIAFGLEPHGDIKDYRVHAEWKTSKRKRIDFAITWSDDGAGPHGLVVEAKFGHHVKSGQLPEYKAFIEKQIATRESVRLVLLSVDAERDRAARNRNKQWMWLSWASFLISHEKALPTEYDDDGFQQFRRTVWWRLTGL
jgi:hypothetical protein